MELYVSRYSLDFKKILICKGEKKYSNKCKPFGFYEDNIKE